MARWSVETLNDTVDRELGALPAAMRARFVQRAGGALVSKVGDLHRKWSRNADYRRAYDDLDFEFALARSLIEARVGAGLTQAQLAERMETTQSVVARLESGRGHPSTRTLETFARSTGTRLRIDFEPLMRFDESRIDELVDQLRKKLPSDRLQELANSFSYPKGEETFTERGADFRKQRHLTRLQAYELVAWKSDRQKTRFLNSNTDTSVRQVTARAARCADDSHEFPEAAAEILNELNGVSYPTASVFLAAWNHGAFGIIDARTWRALKTLTGLSAFDRGKRTLFNREEFRLYTRLLRRWSAREQGTSPRLIDKALWQYDKELGRPLQKAITQEPQQDARE